MDNMKIIIYLYQCLILCMNIKYYERIYYIEYNCEYSNQNKCYIKAFRIT